MRKKFIFPLLMLLFFNGILAQVSETKETSAEQEEETEEEEEFYFEKSISMGFNFQLGFPQGRFGKNVDYTAYGFGGNVMWRFKGEKPLYGGIDFGFQNYDFEGVVDVLSFDEQYETKTKNSVVLAHFQLRYYPEVNFRFQPYFEGLFGAKSLLTRTIITDVTDGVNERINMEFNQSDFALSLGAAIGLEISLKKDYLFLDIRCLYLKGTSAEYYARKKDDSNYIEPIDAFELKKSATDIFTPQIGINFLIGFGGDDYED